MNWYSENLEKQIKKILLDSSLVKHWMKEMSLPVSDIKNKLKIEIADLGENFAEGNGEVIRLDKSLFQDDFFQDNFHFVIHEFVHWMKRRREEEFYFYDYEEIEAFVFQIAWQIVNGKKIDDIYKIFFPIISSHFENKPGAKDFYEIIVSKAKELAKEFE